MAEVFETNPYLILYSGVLKPPPKPADALLDPPRNAAEIAARWREVDAKKNDGVGTTDYERTAYNLRLPEIKTALVDGTEGERRKWIDEARKEIERRFRERVGTFRIGSDMVVTKSGLEKASAGFARWLKRDTMAKLAEREGYKIVDEVGPAEKPLPVPSKPQDWPDKNARAAGVIDKNIPKYIAFLAVHEKRRIGDVYEFLGASSTSPLATLKAKLAEAHAKYNTANASLVNKTPHLQAASSLFRVLDEVLKTDESRRKWERCMALTRIDERLSTSFMARISGGAVSAESYLDAVEKCREEGLSKPDADYYVYEYFIVEKKCPMPRRAVQKEAQEEPRFCGSCHAANPHGAKNCRQCGAPLDVTCPKCGEKAEYGDGNCPHCGFAVGDMPLAADCVADARRRMAAGDLAGAATALAQALVYWPGNVDADAAKRELERLEREAKKREAAKLLESLAIPGVLEATVCDGGTVSLKWSSATMGTGRNVVPATDVMYWVVRREGAQPASPEDGTKLANTTATKYEDTSAIPGAIYAYAVFPSINGVPKRSGVVSQKKMTVADVTDVSAEADDGAVRLTWKNPGKALGAICVRKVGGLPSSMSDGQKVFGQPGKEGFVDSGLANGKLVGYRIFAVFRDPEGKNVASSGVTCDATPASRPAAVGDFRCVTSNGIVSVTWEPLDDAVVSVYRSSAPFAQAGTFVPSNDGVFAAGRKIASVAPGQGNASFAENGSELGYLTLVSEKGGMSLIGASKPLIPCVTNVRAFRRAGNLQLTWDWPKGIAMTVVTFRNDATPTSPTDPMATRRPISKTEYDKTGALVFRDCGTGNFFFELYTVVRKDGADAYSSGVECISLGVMEKMHIGYRFHKKWSLFGGNGGTEVAIVSEGPFPLPDLVVVKKKSALPLSRNDGILVQRIPSVSQPLSVHPLSVSKADTGFYLKIFTADAASEGTVVFNHPPFAEAKV